MARTPTYRSAGLVVVLGMDGDRELLVTMDELRRVVGLLLAWGEPDLQLEAERVAHDLALRLPAE